MSKRSVEEISKELSKALKRAKEKIESVNTVNIPFMIILTAVSLYPPMSCLSDMKYSHWKEDWHLLLPSFFLPVFLCLFLYHIIGTNKIKKEITDEYQTQINVLKDVIKSSSENSHNETKENEANKSMIVVYQTEISKLNVQIKSLEQLHEKKKQSHKIAMDRLKQSYEKKIDKLKQSREKKIDELKQLHKSDIDELKRTYKERMDKLEQSHKSDIDRLERHTVDITNEFEKEREALTKQIDEWKSEYKEEKSANTGRPEALMNGVVKLAAIAARALLERKAMEMEMKARAAERERERDLFPQLSSFTRRQIM